MQAEEAKEAAHSNDVNVIDIANLTIEDLALKQQSDTQISKICKDLAQLSACHKALGSSSLRLLTGQVRQILGTGHRWRSGIHHLCSEQ